MPQLPMTFDASTDAGLTPIPELAGERHVILNLETTGPSWVQGDRPIGLSYWFPASGRHGYLPTGHRVGPNHDPAHVQRFLREVRGCHVDNANTRFDLHMAREWGVDLTAQDNTFGDVLHTAALLDDHTRALSLDAVYQRYTGIDVTQTPLGTLPAGIRHEGEFQHLPGSVVAPYAIRNVRQVAELLPLFQPLVAAEGLQRVLTLEQETILPVVEMEKNGVPLNMPLLVQMEARSQALLERLSWDLYRHVGFTVNPDSPKDMVRLFSQCGEAYPRTATGQPSFTAPVVRAAAERHETIRLAWRIGKLIDLRNKYLVKYTHDQRGGILYPTLHQLLFDDGTHGTKGTISGRFSCVRPNLQQVLNKDKHGRAYGWLLEYGDEDYNVMRLLTSATGHVFAADAKQIEYRIFADLTGSSRLLARYAANPLTDFHQIVMDDFLKSVRPDVTRTETKAVNFLSIFGGKGGAIARTLEIDRTAGDELERQYHHAFPEAKALIDKATGAAEARGWVKDRWGRRCRFPFVRVQHPLTGRVSERRDRTHKALNAIVQGTAASYNKQTLVDLYRERKTFGLTMRMTVHDATYNDIENPDRAHEVGAFLNQQRMDTKVPILWDYGVGDSWATAK